MLFIPDSWIGMQKYGLVRIAGPSQCGRKEMSHLLFDCISD